MKKLIFTLLLAPVLAFASGGSVKLDKWPGSVADKPALQNGAKLFVNHCLNCHGASYLRYNKLLDLGFTEEEVKENLMFTADKIGEPLRIAAHASEQKQWFGAAPPDLTVIARARSSEDGPGTDWLYTYLRKFYRDENRPTGWNNVVFENVGMPHALWDLQGEQWLNKETHQLELRKPGKMSAAEYDQAVSDLVGFMSWMGEPMQEQRKRIGWGVLAFLGIMFIFAYRLKKAYWKDIK